MRVLFRTKIFYHSTSIFAIVPSVTLIDDDYPSSLKKIPCPPFVLYYCGDLEDINEKEISLFHVGALKHGYRYFIPSPNYSKHFIACDNPSEFSTYLEEFRTIYKDCI